MIPTSLYFWKRLWFIGLSALVFLASSSLSFAGDIKLLAGAGITTQILPLAGASAALSSQSDDTSLFFLPAFKSETALTYYNLSGTGQLTRDGVTGTVGVTLVAYELDYFATVDIAGLRIGPGVGYGVATTTEGLSISGGNQLGDPSPFFSANDIHYGVLMLKVSKSWSFITCDGIGSSFGGLIGGSLLCGVLF